MHSCTLRCKSHFPLLTRPFRWALPGQHFLTEVPRVFKVSCICHSSSPKSNPTDVPRPQIKSTSKYSLKHNAIHLECFYRLHSCPSIVTDNSGRQCRGRGRDEFTLSWTNIVCLSVCRCYVVCGESEHSAHRPLTAGITCRTITSAQRIDDVKVEVALMKPSDEPSYSRA